MCISSWGTSLKLQAHIPNYFFGFFTWLCERCLRFNKTKPEKFWSASVNLFSLRPPLIWLHFSVYSFKNLEILLIFSFSLHYYFLLSLYLQAVSKSCCFIFKIFPNKFSSSTLFPLLLLASTFVLVSRTSGLDYCHGSSFSSSGFPLICYQCNNQNDFFFFFKKT